MIKVGDTVMVVYPAHCCESPGKKVFTVTGIHYANWCCFTCKKQEDVFCASYLELPDGKFHGEPLYRLVKIAGPDVDVTQEMEGVV